jgi:hypothetical protein
VSPLLLPLTCWFLISLLQRYVESEILNHSTLRHPHVVQFREVFLSPNHVSFSRSSLTASTNHLPAVLLTK